MSVNFDTLHTTCTKSKYFKGGLFLRNIMVFVISPNVFIIQRNPFLYKEFRGHWFCVIVWRYVWRNQFFRESGLYLTMENEKTKDKKNDFLIDKVQFFGQVCNQFSCSFFEHCTVICLVKNRPTNTFCLKIYCMNYKRDTF